MTKISASEDFAQWLSTLAPTPKRRVRLALRNLAKGKGDIKSLQGDLEGYCRLRIGGMRVIFHYQGSKEIFVLYGNIRDVVYELFQQFLGKGDS